VASACAAGVWIVACLELAHQRGAGQLRVGSRRGIEGRRWQLLDLYCERLAGEEATGMASTRGPLARRARRVFRTDEDLAFLRRVQTDSRSGPYRTAAGRILEDLPSG
jgi:hypothetical protein